MADRPSAFEAAFDPKGALEANKVASEIERADAEKKARNNHIKKRKLAKKAEAEALAAKKEAQLLADNAASQERYSEAKAVEMQATAEANEAEAELAAVESAAFTEKAKAVAPFALGGLLIAGVFGAIFMFRR